jgi:hypothetical protein
VPPVIVRPWVEADIYDAVLHDRSLLGQILFDLNNHLPNNHPSLFTLRRLRFVVRDSDPSVLEVIWVVVVG